MVLDHIASCPRQKVSSALRETWQAAGLVKQLRAIWKTVVQRGREKERERSQLYVQPNRQSALQIRHGLEAKNNLKLLIYKRKGEKFLSWHIGKHLLIHNLYMMIVRQASACHMLPLRRPACDLEDAYTWKRSNKMNRIRLAFQRGRRNKAPRNRKRNNQTNRFKRANQTAATPQW